jgi:hypothetical protein
MRQDAAPVVSAAVPRRVRAGDVSNGVNDFTGDDAGKSAAGGHDAPVEAGDPLNDIASALARYEFDPYGFVLWAFPWGEPGTALAREDGPEEWQRAQLLRIGTKLARGIPADDALAEYLGVVVEEDISAGHGVGKSALVSWLILWAISTHADTRGVVTANTEKQLATKTWAELGKWHNMFVARELFHFTATSIYSTDKKHERTWRIDAIPWSEKNPEAFAGLHNQGKRILVIFDEASTISDIIWETTEGALTDRATQIIWCRYGNPTRTSGEFHRRCSQPRRNAYHRVDGRTVRFTNKQQIQEWIDEYGEDSDFVRVRVLGKFPRAGSSNFVSPELTEGARRRSVPRMNWESQPRILSCDPARFGDDWTVITLRQGYKVHFQQGLMGFDGVEVGGRIAELCRQIGGIMCIVYDAIGNGADLDSTLRRIPGLPTLMPIQWGIPAQDDKQYFNQRAEAWGKMREWLKHGEIPDDDELCDQITSLDYAYDLAYRIQLESKKDAKKRGVPSPDKADSLALSMLPDVVQRKMTTAKVREVKTRKVVWQRTSGGIHVS